MSAWETSVEALDSELRRKFDDDEEFADEDELPIRIIEEHLLREFQRYR